MNLVEYIFRGLIHAVASTFANNGTVSRDTLRSILGVVLLIPLVLTPTAVVIAVLFVLRKASLRAIGIMNLMCALWWLLCFATIAAGIRGSALAPASDAIAHPEVLVSVSGMLMFIWLASAIGLFYRVRLAWLGSLFGAIAQGLFFVTGIVSLVQELRHPAGEVTGYRASDLMAALIGITIFGLALALTLGLVHGLLRIRKDIFGGGAGNSGGLAQTALSRPIANQPPL